MFVVAAHRVWPPSRAVLIEIEKYIATNKVSADTVCLCVNMTTETQFGFSNGRPACAHSFTVSSETAQ